MGTIIKMLFSVQGYFIVYEIVFFVVLFLVTAFFEKKSVRLIIGGAFTVISWQILYNLISDRITIKWLLIAYMVVTALGTLLAVLIVAETDSTGVDSKEETTKTEGEEENVTIAGNVNVMEEEQTEIPETENAGE